MQISYFYDIGKVWPAVCIWQDGNEYSNAIVDTLHLLINSGKRPSNPFVESAFAIYRQCSLLNNSRAVLDQTG